MTKKVSYEIYEGLDKRKKKYVVVPDDCTKSVMEAAAKYLMRLNHCSLAHIDVQAGYIYKGQLYLLRPSFKARIVFVLTYIR